MKTNNFLTDVLRGPWMVNSSVATKYEVMLNKFLKGEFRGEPIDRKEFYASLGSGGFSNNIDDIPKEIKIVPMRGVLAAYGEVCVLGADDYKNILRNLNEDESVGAVILDIDGFGSSVSAINIMAELVDEKQKPFIALMNNCFSGHYWIASMLCDHLMAYGDVSSSFGSIGVLMNVTDGRDAMEKEGYKVKVIRAPQSITKAQTAVDFYNREDEKFEKALQEEMRPMADAFINAIKKYRPNLNHDLEGLFTGSTYPARVALENGLIDSIGDEKKAIERAKILIELKN